MSDGYFTVGGLLNFLDMEGFDVVAITDHNHYTIPYPIHIRENAVEDLLIIHGIEITFPQIHMICLESIKHETVRDCIDTARVSWLAHPNFPVRIPPEDCEYICEKYHLNGLELYNSGLTQFKGDWDRNFYAGDDLHIPSQVMKSWMEMNVGSLDKETVIEKLLSGDYELKNIPPDDAELCYTEALDFPGIR